MWWRRKQPAEVSAMLATVRVLRFDLSKHADKEINAAVDRFVLTIGKAGGRTSTPGWRLEGDRLLLLFNVLTPMEGLEPRPAMPSMPGMPPMPGPPPGPPPRPPVGTEPPIAPPPPPVGGP